jgi:ABC-type branched-subunit amino acid transport system substrate-binding protein
VKEGYTVRVKLIVMLVAAAATSLAAVSIASGGSTAKSKFKGPPITMMIVAPVETVFQSQPEAYAGAQAAANAVNKAGGIQKRPLQLLFCDDKGTPTGAVACAQQAVAKKVTAVQMTINFGSQVYPILKEAGIPAIGNNPFTAADLTDPMSFPMVPGSNIYHSAVPFLVAQAKKNSLAVASYDIASALNNVKIMQDSSVRASINYKGTATFPATTTDWAPIVQRLKNFDADAIEFVTAGGAVPPILQSAQQFGLKALWVLNPTAASPQIIDAAKGLLEGALVVSPLPGIDASPRFKIFHKEMDAAGKAGVNYTDRRATISAISWLAVKGLAAIGNQMKKPVTSANLIAEMNKAKNIDVGPGVIKWSPGVAGPSDFPRLSNGIIWPLKVKGSGLVPYGKAIDAFKSNRLS